MPKKIKNFKKKKPNITKKIKNYKKNLKIWASLIVATEVINMSNWTHMTRF